MIQIGTDHIDGRHQRTFIKDGWGEKRSNYFQASKLRQLNVLLLQPYPQMEINSYNKSTTLKRTSLTFCIILTTP